MQIQKPLTASVAFLLLIFSLSAQEKYSKVKIPVKSGRIKQFVFSSLNLDHFTYEGDAVVAVLNSSELNTLKQSGYAYSVIANDMSKYTFEKNSREKIPDPSGSRAAFQMSCKQVANIISTPSSFTAGSITLGSASGYGYYTYDEMVTKMNALVTAYPSLVSLQTIGTSYEGRTIYGVKISDNVSSDESEPEVLYTGLQHAREAIGGTSLIFFAQYLAENYAGNSDIKNLVDNREIFIIPCVNPDGYIYNYTGTNSYTSVGYWRKNRRDNGDGTYGVDLNRNYGVDWANCAGATSSCGSSTTSSDTYWGTSSFSEPETRAVKDFVTGHNFIAAIDQHCTGPYYSLPFGRPSLHTMSTSDTYFYTHIPALMGLYNCHRAGNSPETVNYEVAGGIKDWLLMGDIGTGSKGKIYGMTGEAGGDDFWASVTMIPQLTKELCFQNLQLAYAAGAYFDIQDKSDIVLTATSGSLSYSLRSIGRDTTTSVKVSVVPIQNISSVGAAVTTTIGSYYGTSTNSINYTLPSSITSGQKIRFAWKVEAGGIAVYDTVTKFYNPVTLLYDNMEGSLTTNWSVPSGGPASNKWAFTTTAAYAGSQSLTESPSGNYSTNNSRTVTYKNTFDLSNATAAWLSFWVKHRAENCRDKLQVQVSTNNSTWTPLCGTSTVAEPNTTGGGTLGGLPALTGIRENWTKELFDLSAYDGSSTLYLRFNFTSDGDGGSYTYETDDGFYIDEVKVLKSTTAILSLPVRFTKFTGRLTDENTIALNWEAFVDPDHDYFVIEKSVDGFSFKEIGISKTNPPYSFIDNNPVNGNNLYRIKAVDLNGKANYTNVINVVMKQGKTHFSVYPNPVRDGKIFISVWSDNTANATLKIADISGKVVMVLNQKLAKGNNTIKLDVKNGLTPGIYLVQLLNQSEKYQSRLLIQK